MAKAAKTIAKKRTTAQKKKGAKAKSRPKRMSAAELARKHNITADAVRKKMSRHGFKAGKDRKYSEADFLRAHKAGLQADKAAASKRSAGVSDDGPTLQAVLLDGKTRLLDIQIQKAQAELDQMLGNVVPLEEHKATVQKVQLMMLTWWDQAAENAATKIKNAQVLAELRRARDMASAHILELVE